MPWLFNSRIIENLDLVLVMLVLIGVLILFAWNKWRYDIVALIALMFLTLAGIIDPDEAFMGFAHPAVITVAAVLVVTRGLIHSGLIDVIIKMMTKAGENYIVQLSVLLVTVAVLSAFMNNIGAMALLLPIAVKMARKAERSPALYLMPLAFGSLLGGLITLIGTPPNIIIAMARAESGAQPFGMFDFAPVGIITTVVGLLFILLLGWRLIPKRENSEAGQMIAHIKDYITELKVPKGSALVGRPVKDIAKMTDSEVVIMELIRRRESYKAPSAFKVIKTSDILVVKGCTENIKTLIDDLGLELTEKKEFDDRLTSEDEVEMAEVVVKQNSLMKGKTVQELKLHDREGLNLLAISREGRDIQGRLDSTRIREGDMLLVRGPKETISSSITNLGLVPLASGDLNLGRPRRIYLALAIFSVGILAAAFNVLPIAVAIMAVAVVMLMTGLIPVKDLYTSIDWPIIILLGAMIPVGMAFDQVGGTTLVANLILGSGPMMTPHLTVLVIMVVSMVLSNILNNAAVAVVMAPLAIEIANKMSVSADPMLMAVAIGASCAFMTPIGHQSNALVMGPGGYRFTDYWPMGLPLQILVMIVALPSIFMIWPF